MRISASLQDFHSNHSGGPSVTYDLQQPPHPQRTTPWWRVAEPLTELELLLGARLSFPTKHTLKVPMIMISTKVQCTG
jgi:hypothetical protein